MSVGPQSEDIDLYQTARTLKKLSIQLRVLGLSALCFTLLLAGLVVEDAAHMFSVQTNIYIPITALVLVLIALVFFESRKRRGDQIYGNLTDQLHNMRMRGSEREQNEEFRNAVHQYARSSDPPLVGGRQSLAVYFFMNLILISVFAGGQYAKQQAQLLAQSTTNTFPSETDIRDFIDTEVSKLAREVPRYYFSTSEQAVNANRLVTSTGTVLSAICPAESYLTGIEISRGTRKSSGPAAETMVLHCARFPEVKSAKP